MVLAEFNLKIISEIFDNYSTIAKVTIRNCLVLDAVWVMLNDMDCDNVLRMRISHLVDKATSHFRQHCSANTDRFLHTVKDWFRSASSISVLFVHRELGCRVG